MDKLTAKQKLDQMFGIAENSSVDEFLDKLSSDPDKTMKDMSNAIDNTAEDMKDVLAKVDQGIQELKSNPNAAPATLVDLNASMKEMEDLISLSKEMFKHVYEAVTTTDLVDSELVSSASQLLTAIHDNMFEFITLYKERQAFVDKIRVLVLQQEQKKELMALKHKYDMEKLQAKLDTDTVDTNAIAFSVADMAKMLNEADEKMLLDVEAEAETQS